MAYRDWARRDVEHKLVCGLLVCGLYMLHFTLLSGLGAIIVAGAQNRNFVYG